MSVLAFINSTKSWSCLSILHTTAQSDEWHKTGELSKLHFSKGAAGEILQAVCMVSCHHGGLLALGEKVEMIWRCGGFPFLFLTAGGDVLWSITRVLYGKLEEKSSVWEQVYMTVLLKHRDEDENAQCCQLIKCQWTIKIVCNFFIAIFKRFFIRFCILCPV